MTNFITFYLINFNWGVAAGITNSYGFGKCASLNSAVAGKPFLHFPERNNSGKSLPIYKDRLQVPGGLREWSEYSTPGAFRAVLGMNGWWWSSTRYGNGGWHRNLYFANTTIQRYGEPNGSFGLSIRCLRYLTGSTLYSLKLKV